MHFTYRHDRLYCEDVAVDDLAAQYGTPLYVYSTGQVRDNIALFAGPAAHPAPIAVAYALKANANPELLAIIRSAGLGADVVSGGELAAALRAGFPADRISYAGVGKRDDEIIFGIEHRIGMFCVESEEELAVVDELARRANTRARIAIRVNPDIDAGTHPYISTGMHHNKFGLAPDDARAAYRAAAAMPGVEIVGVHAHIGSQIASSEPFVDAARAIASFVRSLHGDGIDVRHINLGGGFAVAYRDTISHPLVPRDDNGAAPAPPDEILHSMAGIVGTTGCTVSIEPGRAIVATAGVLLTRTLYTKRTAAKHFTIVDAAMNDLIRPCLYDAYHQIVPSRVVDRHVITTDVVGPVCETSDFLARDRALREPERGDLLAVMCAGAYGYALASNYTLRGRPAEVLVDGAGARIIRERERML